MNCPSYNCKSHAQDSNKILVQTGISRLKMKLEENRKRVDFISIDSDNNNDNDLLFDTGDVTELCNDVRANLKFKFDIYKAQKKSNIKFKLDAYNSSNKGIF